MRLHAVGLLLCAVLRVDAAAPPASGLYQWSRATGRSTYLGPFGQPSIDPENRFLYVTNEAGELLRWSLDNLTIPPARFAKPGAGEPLMSWPLAAPARGQVAVFRDFSNNDGTRRTCLEVWSREGLRLRGPLPIVTGRGLYNGTHLAAWHPDGEVIAFPVTEGQPKRGLYVFRPSNRNWVLAEAFAADFAGPLPVLRMSPNGRTMSHISGGRMYLRAGGDWASYANFPVGGRLHGWVNNEVLGVVEPNRGMVLYDVTGARVGQLEGYQALPELDASLLAVSPAGVAWVQPGPDRTLELKVQPAAGGAPETAASFGAASRPYGLISAPPVWHPSEAVLFYWVP